MEQERREDEPAQNGSTPEGEEEVPTRFQQIERMEPQGVVREMGRGEGEEQQTGSLAEPGDRRRSRPRVQLRASLPAADNSRSIATVISGASGSTLEGQAAIARPSGPIRYL